MTLRTPARLAGLAVAVLASPAAAEGLRVEITLPEIAVASYYRPYLSAWIEQGESRDHAGTLAVWYDMRLRDNLGQSWLRNLRSWWRAAGSEMTLPADGVSGPTRAPGTHVLDFPADHPALAALAPGPHTLAVEVVRENGERELLRAPFEWGAASDAMAEGETEITRMRVESLP